MLTDVLHSGPSCKYVPTGALVARAASWVQSQLGPLRHTTHYTKSLRHTCGQHRPPAAPARKKFFRKNIAKNSLLAVPQTKKAPQCIIHQIKTRKFAAPATNAQAPICPPLRPKSSHRASQGSNGINYTRGHFSKRYKVQRG